MSGLKEKIFCPMSAEHENAYLSTCAERILHYDGIFLFIIVVIQIYNIIYALLYTQGRLHTTASRVYTVLYLLLLFFTIAGLILQNYLRKSFPQKVKFTVRLQKIYGFILLLWGACITLYDQRVSNNISVYVIISLSVAVLVYFTPLESIAAYIFFLIVLTLFLPFFQEQPRDNYGAYVNISVVTLMSIFISAYRALSDRKHYLSQQIIIEQNQQLSHLANVDSLTGLRNRRFLENEIGPLYQTCAENNWEMTVMMIDIDFFKAYNDRFGHPQGDECLRRMAWRLEQELDASSEYLIRYGGEEFLYIGTALGTQAAIDKAQQFNDVIRKLIIGPSDQDPRGITISIGICTRLPSKAPAEQEWLDYIAEADKALYIAKANGRDRWAAF